MELVSQVHSPLQDLAGVVLGDGGTRVEVAGLELAKVGVVLPESVKAMDAELDLSNPVILQCLDEEQCVSEAE